MRLDRWRAFVRQQPCCLEGLHFKWYEWTNDRLREKKAYVECDVSVECAHHTRRGHGSMGKKTCDLRTVPLCRAHHAWAHAHLEAARPYLDEALVEYLHLLTQALIDDGGVIP